MSESDDLVLIREAYRVWNEGGIAAATASRFMHADIEWTTPPEVPGGGHLVGREATMAYLREWEGTMGVLNLSFVRRATLLLDRAQALEAAGLSE